MIARYSEPHHRDVQGRGRRAGRDPGSPASAAASLHPQAARRDAAPSASCGTLPDTGTPIVEVRDLVVDYKRPAGLLPQGSRQARASRHRSSTSSRGEVVALVGGSGSGKTTLGRAIAGLLKPTGGEILFAAARSFPSERGLLDRLSPELPDGLPGPVFLARSAHDHRRPWSARRCGSCRA